MNAIVILILLLKTTIDCRHAAINVKSSEIEEFSSTVNRTNEEMDSVLNNFGNGSRMTLPSDVEWIRPTPTQNQQQIIIPAINSIFELIFAVNFMDFFKD